MSNSVRSRLLAVLSPSAVIHISIDLGCGAGLAWLAVSLIALGSHENLGWPDWLLILPALLIGGVAGAVSVGLLRRVVHLLGETRAALRSWLPAGVVVLVIAGCLAALSFLGGSPDTLGKLIAEAAAAALPALLVLVFGVWACLLTQRRVRASRFRWLRRVPDVLAALLIALALVAAFRPELLATEPAAGLLFPLTAWFSVRTWRVMDRSGQLAVRAGADIAASLLLGADLVLFLVWLANLFDLPGREVAVLRGALGRTGDIVDLPWWWWAGLYILLAGSSLAFALWPERLSAVSGWWQRLRAVPSIGVTKRVMSGVHIGLAVTMLIGLTAPTALDAALRGRLQAKYRLALQRELAADGERAAYAEIRRQFTTTGLSALPSAYPLIGIVDKVHSISRPPPGRDEATSTERDIARRLGQLQAAALRVSPPPTANPAAAGKTGPGSGDEGKEAESEAPRGGVAAELHARLDELDQQEQRSRTITKRANEAGELAATAVAATIQIPGLGQHEIVQIITEYLSGLVESSPLKDVFAAWARRLAGRTTPPPADRLVVPDPLRLEEVAFTVLLRERFTVRLADPLATDQAQERTLRESPGDAAVDLANETRFLEEDSGPCEGCPRPLKPGDETVEGPEEHPEEPHEPIR